MSGKFFVDKLKFVVLSAFALVFLLCAAALWLADSRAAAGGCVLLAAVYLYFAAQNAAQILVDGTGVSRSFLWFAPTHCSWDELREVGVFGNKVFNRSDPKKTGSLYIYFSPQKMTADERFNMILRWPPKLIYFSYSRQALDLVRYLWNRELVGYNIGELKL